MALVDTHCHLDYEVYDEDRAEVLARAQDSGVVAVIVPGTNEASSSKALDLAEQNDMVYAAAGVHPNDAADWDDGSIARLGEMAQSPKMVAIGEIGLDYYRDWTPPQKQRTLFERQLELAAKLDLPVIVHNRQADDDLMTMLIDWQQGLASADAPLAQRPGVLHSFQGDRAMAEKALAHHFLLGITGPVTFKNAPELQALAAELPVDHLLVETDSPYLSPHPQRGQRNEPGRVRLVAEKLAELQGTTFDEFAEATTANARRLFRMDILQLDTLQ
ncbi:MAG: TatD family deoxyribonuclease [Chloroflexi bacterium]|nr:TatD family deoxyribonuclease [Chloroflexota bacterium]